jgi:uncharacterized coiled-coil DUF342 family protein
MVTKDEERKALEQIKKIIKGLGTDSYIGAAIDQTVLNLAEDNINNDFMITTTESIENASAKLEEVRTELRDTRKERDDLKKSIEIETNRVTEAHKKNDELRTRNSELLTDLIAAQTERDQQKQEIITLKAKLYDLITA